MSRVQDWSAPRLAVQVVAPSEKPPRGKEAKNRVALPVLVIVIVRVAVVPSATSPKLMLVGDTDIAAGSKTISVPMLVGSIAAAEAGTATEARLKTRAAANAGKIRLTRAVSAVP